MGQGGTAGQKGFSAEMTSGGSGGSGGKIFEVSSVNIPSGNYAASIGNSASNQGTGGNSTFMSYSSSSGRIRVYSLNGKIYGGNGGNGGSGYYYDGTEDRIYPATNGSNGTGVGGKGGNGGKGGTNDNSYGSTGGSGGLSGGGGGGGGSGYLAPSNSGGAGGLGGSGFVAIQLNS